MFRIWVLTFLSLSGVAIQSRAQSTFPGFPSIEMLPTVDTNSRLTSSASYVRNSGDLRLIDSVRVRYSGARGSRYKLLNSNQLSAFTIANYGDFGEYAFYPEFQGTYIHHDTLIHMRYPAGPFPATDIYTRQYDAVTGMIIRMTGPRWEQLYRYDSKGRLAEILMLSLSGVRDTQMKNYYFYDNNSRLIADSCITYAPASGVWLLRGIREVHYNAAGLPDTMIERDEQRIGQTLGPPSHLRTYSYTPSGKLAVYRLSYFNPSTRELEYGDIDSFVYLGKQAIYHETRRFDQAKLYWYTTSTNHYYLNAYGQPDSLVLNDPSISSFDQKVLITYGAAQEITKVQSFREGSDTAWTEDRYYYEPLPEDGHILPIVKVFRPKPNPASNQLQLDNNMEGTFRVTDMSGQVQLEGSVGAGGFVTIYMLAPGSYMLTFNQADGQRFTGRFLKL